MAGDALPKLGPQGWLSAGVGHTGVTVTAEMPLATGRGGTTPWLIPVPCPPTSHPCLLLVKGALLQPEVKRVRNVFPSGTEQRTSKGLF